MVPHVQHLQGPCGQRFHALQDGEPMTHAKCWCSTFAICECAVCGQPLCGDHRYLRAERWHCKEDARAIDAEAKRAADAVAAAAEAREQERLARISELADPIERLLRERAPRPAPMGNYVPDWPAIAATIERAGGQGRSDGAEPGAWASARIAAWFAARAGGTPFDAELPELGPSRRRLLGGGNTRPKVLGQFGLWLFARGGDMGSYGATDIGIVQDGRLVWADASASSFSGAAKTMSEGYSSSSTYTPRFNELGLSQLAKRLGF
jgi:hypothetical protein